MRSTFRRGHFVVGIILFLFFICLLTGCAGVTTYVNVTVSIQFYQNDYWNAIIEIRTPSSNSEAVDSQYNVMIQKAKDFGLSESHNKQVVDQELIYKINLSGNNLQALSVIAFQEQAVIQRKDSNGRQKLEFRIPSWNPPVDGFTLSLFISAGQILNGNGKWQGTDNSESMAWQLGSQGQDAFLFFSPQACITQSPTSIDLLLLPESKWLADIKILNLSQGCTKEQYAQELSGIVSFAKDNEIYSEWESNFGLTEQSTHLKLEGQGIENLNKTIFDDQGKIDLYQDKVVPDKISLSFPNMLRVGLHIEELNITGSKIIQGNGLLVDNHKMQWVDFSNGTFVEVETASYFPLADAALTVDLMTGQQWFSVMDVHVIPIYEKFAPQVETELFAYINMLSPDVKTDISTVVNKTSSEYLVEFQGQDLSSLNSTIFNNDAVFSIDESQWMRQINFRQTKEPHWQFHSLALTLRGGDVISSNGTIGQDGFSGVHTENLAKWSQNQSVTWQPFGVGASAILTEKFVFSTNAVYDISIYWLQKLSATLFELYIWVIAVAVLLGIIILLRRYLVSGRTKWWSRA